MRFRWLLKRGFRALGFDVRRLDKATAPGGMKRPIGDMAMLLQDLRARGLACTSILDVGAHRGDWSREASRIFPEAHFSLVEPLSEMAPFLDRFCQDSVCARWYMVAAGEQCTQDTFTAYDDLATSTFLPYTTILTTETSSSRVVPVVTIDSLLRKGLFAPPELVKVDVQGYELEVLRGSMDLFGQTEVFILETSLYRFAAKAPLFHEVVNFMAAKGYLVYDFPGFLRRPYDGALGQVDVCFVRANGQLRASGRWR